MRIILRNYLYLLQKLFILSVNCSCRLVDKSGFTLQCTFSRTAAERNHTRDSLLRVSRPVSQVKQRYVAKEKHKRQASETE